MKSASAPSESSRNLRGHLQTWNISHGTAGGVGGYMALILSGCFEVPLREARTRCDMFEAEEGSSLLDTPGPFECQAELGSDKAPRPGGQASRCRCVSMATAAMSVSIGLATCAS